MSDSMNTNKDLDSYGVWVKRPGKSSSSTEVNEPVIDNAIAEEKINDIDDIDIQSLEDFPVENMELPDIVENAAENNLNDDFPSDDVVGDDISSGDIGNDVSSDAFETVQLDDLVDDIDIGDIKDDFVETENTEDEINNVATFNEIQEIPEMTAETESAESDIEVFDIPTELSDNTVFSEDSFVTENVEEDISADISPDISTSIIDIDKTVDETIDETVDEADGSSIDAASSIGEILEEPMVDDVELDKVAADEISGMDFIDESSLDESVANELTESTEPEGLSDISIEETTDSFDEPVVEDSILENTETMIENDDSSFETSDDFAQETFDTETGAIAVMDEEPLDSASKTSENDDIMPDTNEVLKQIVADLSELKSEIVNLKNDFATLRSRETLTEYSTLSSDISHEEPVSESGGFFSDADEDETIALSGNELDDIMSNTTILPAEEEEPASESGGFFSDADEDETIALSGNELSNIMNTANFSEEDAPSESETDDFQETNDFIDEVILPTEEENLTMDFEHEELTEPNLDEINLEDDIEDDDLPSEISVTKIEDVIVDSSSSDFMESVTETDDTEYSAPITEFDIPEELPDDAENITEEENTVSLDDVSEDVSSDDLNNIDTFDVPDPKIHESITDTHIDYLKTDENIGVPIDEDHEISHIERHETEFPSDLQSEIKSVLLYMDQLLENLPEDKIVEFAQSEQFGTYKKLFADLGLS